MSEKKFEGVKAVLMIDGKPVGTFKNLEWRRAGDPIPMDKPDYKAAARKLAAEIEFDLARGRQDFSSPQPTLTINGEAVPWRR